MAQNRQGKHKRTTMKERNAIETTQDVEEVKEFSERLSFVMNYFAVNDHVIEFKRKMMLASEREITIVQKAIGRNRQIYMFGSKIEGTTTNGMMSDRDVLSRFDTFRLFLDSENLPSQLNDHQVVIKVSTNGCASQYCVLTMIEPSKQARRFEKMDPNRDPLDIVHFFRKKDWPSTDGMIPHSIMFNRHQVLGQVERHGPAESIRTIDIVNACYCKSLPKQCKFVFERPRPGHWPSEKTLKKAQTYGVFIVPQGPPKSTNICTNDYFEYQWRLSSNLTERLLMFSLDTVHLQAYVLTKMLRKELFVPEYQDRLSTYHFKTAFLFAVENTPSHVWRECNMYNCVKYILATLRRFLTRKNCPHFTIENVNLFEGKIKIHEFPKLVNKFTNVMNSLRTQIEHIEMDNIGELLKTIKHAHRMPRVYSTLFSEVLQVVMDPRHQCQFSGTTVSNRIATFEKEITYFETYHRAPMEKYRKYDYEFRGFMSAMASFGASAYLEHNEEGNEYNGVGFNKARHMFTQSLESNIICNYMRYASFLFCNGEYDKACSYFDVIEKQIEKDKQSNPIYQLCVCTKHAESLALKISKQSYGQIFKPRWSVFLNFTQAEAMCYPEFLRCGMYQRRLGTVDSTEKLPCDFFYDNENSICVHIEPYLYYLQYLTYRVLKQGPKQSEALMKLSKFTQIFKPTKFTSTEGDIFLSHFDTSLNMLGHCLELENKFKSAWKTYKKSLQMLPQRNEAILHIIRLLWQVYQSPRT